MKSCKSSLLSLLVLFFCANAFAQENEEVNYNIANEARTKDFQRWEGRVFVYHTLGIYDDNKFEVPYPFVGGRIRDGKYKASKSTLNTYIESLKQKNGKKFKFIEYTKIDDRKGILFSSEEGDTIFYSSLSLLPAEFVSEEFLKNVKSTIGQTLVITGIPIGIYNDEDLSKDEKMICDHRYKFTDASSGNILPLLPLFSEWKVKGVDEDYTYWGGRKFQNTLANAFTRVQFIIENPHYGTFKVFANELKALANKPTYAYETWYGVNKTVSKAKDDDDDDDEEEEDHSYRYVPEYPIIMKKNVLEHADSPLEIILPIGGYAYIYDCGKNASIIDEPLNTWCSKGYDDALFTKYWIYLPYASGEMYKKLESDLKKTIDHGFFPAMYLLHDVDAMEKLYNAGKHYSDMGLSFNAKGRDHNTVNKEKYLKMAKDCGYKY